MWLYLRILKILWTVYITNERVIERMNKDKEVRKTIQIRKLVYLGHIMRIEERYELLQLVLQAKGMGRSRPDSRRISWLKTEELGLILQQKFKMP